MYPPKEKYEVGFFSSHVFWAKGCCRPTLKNKKKNVGKQMSWVQCRCEGWPPKKTNKDTLARSCVLSLCVCLLARLLLFCGDWKSVISFLLSSTRRPIADPMAYSMALGGMMDQQPFIYSPHSARSKIREKSQQKNPELEEKKIAPCSMMTRLFCFVIL